MHFRSLSLAALLLAGTAPVAAQNAPPIVQPGAPGQQGKALSAQEASDLADTRFSPDDVKFMQDMIVHHQQAVDMVALVDERTNNETLRAAADRIRASQGDEIQFMRDWLEQRGRTAPDPAHMQHMQHAGMGDMAGHHATMQGMATPAQMKELATLKGGAFDRMFLTLMIAHHEGAIDMVDDLLDQPGSAYDPVLFEFTNDVTNEQQSEIDRMSTILAGLSTDPRAQLAAGLTDAGVAAQGLTLVEHLPKPAGFFDPANPGGLQPEIVKADAEAAEEPTSETSSDGKEGTQFGSRSSLLSFANTDMAFQGDMMVAGNYHGFNVYRLDPQGMPNLVSSVVCPGGQGDISLVGDILIMSVEQTRGRVDCGLQGVQGDVSEDRFRGLRIFDISNPAAPVQVGQVQTCRGSHTHSVVDADRNRIIVYNSGTASVRDEEELAGCVGDVPGDQNTALFSIDVIEIPLADPGKARIVDRPRVFAEDGQIAGLWRGGDHGDGTQRTSRTDQCHDITVFPSKKIAAGACSGNGILLDISDPMKPRRIAAVSDPGFAYWHSATFNNDGTKVIFTDEWGGGARPRCRTYDPRGYGADAIYDIEGDQLVRRGTYKLPAPQGDMENCVAHNGSAVPVPGRDIFVQAWYQGGISVIDFTDSANPKEIAYFDRGPIDDEQLVLGGFWSAYYYKGKIYGTEIARGLDVLALEPTDALSPAEIAAAAEAQYPGGVFNPQTQYPVTWPQAALDAVEKERSGG
ncbi:DUF305 domain-containing protein [Erythrobacter sp. LQ02-29]|uniref:DUF305 domain-containing protein n=1 Tax=Erythrobacter sp. LQ02-29 TaxID=2920384 RepID=UPI001F4E20D5|nr:DUF305 domain-containing protein [Erythrobacter sp. LQ02-29]MCP9222905.1 DUF305 domain-containing protein [Erythrobacter sp. LQ02-29]